MPDRAYVSTRKGLFILDRAGSGWSVGPPAFLASNVTLTLPDRRGGVVFVALNHGHFGAKLHRSADHGVTWEECAAPTYPSMPEGALPEKDAFGRAIPWALQLIWSLEPGGAPDELWLGTIPGGLFHSVDGARSWRLVESLWNHPLRREWVGGGADLPGIHSICVDPRDPSHISVGVSCGGVWVTRDHGSSWACKANGMRAAYLPPDQQFNPNSQDPHRLVQCPAVPQHYWAQHHNGIFRSVDDCESWTEVTGANPSTFGFAVAVHPSDGDTAWFVPAGSDEQRIPVDGKVVVTRTRDGGRTFETLRDGLPQRDAYDLVYRHALDVDNEGNQLIFGSTTGTVWLSEDGGDSWKTLFTHLPPVYAVRFA